MSDDGNKKPEKPEAQQVDWAKAAEAIKGFVESPQAKAWAEGFKAISESPKLKEWGAILVQVQEASKKLEPKLQEWAAWAKAAQETLDRYKPDENGIVHIPEIELRALIRRREED